MFLECTCDSCGSLQEWERLMKGRRKFSYKKLCRMIKETLPDLYEALALQFYNPWHKNTAQTETHYIMCHSATEYFFRKE